MQNPMPIRAILGRFWHSVAHRAMEEVMKRHPFEFCGIISVGTDPWYFEGLPTEHQEWFCSAQIRGCNYSGVDWNELEPLDEGLIDRMRDCEAIFMNMVSRLEWKRSIAYMTRKRWYLRHLRFWNDYITRNRINLYLSAVIPHEIPDIIIYHLCKCRNIPVLYFRASTERDISFAEHTFGDSGYQIVPRYEELLREYEGFENPEQIPLSKELDERYSFMAGKAGKMPPIESIKRAGYWEEVRRLVVDKPVQLVRYGLHFFTPQGLERAFHAFERWRIIRERNAFYDARAIEPDFEKPFVYFPLHFQPEASTMPMGGAYVDQKLIARLLNASVPDGVLIYVKEHPRESGWLSRDVQYYKDLLELKKVRLVGRDVSTFKLREGCSAVATVTGTAGFEGLFRGKPVLLFGHCFYQHARGVYRIHSAGDCKRAVKAIFEDGVAPTLKECRLYLKAMEDTCVHSSLCGWHIQLTRQTDEENVRENTRAIREELGHLRPARLV